jgi:hypothetical protein
MSYGADFAETFHQVTNATAMSQECAISPKGAPPPCTAIIASKKIAQTRLGFSPVVVGEVRSLRTKKLAVVQIFASQPAKRAEPRGVRQITYARTWSCDAGAYPPDEWTIQSEGESDE